MWWASAPVIRISFSSIDSKKKRGIYTIIPFNDMDFYMNASLASFMKSRFAFFDEF